MKRNSDYSLVKIEDTFYLLPFGQMVAEHKAGIRLNETGVYIWNLLKDDLTLEEIIAHCADYYQISDAKDLLELSKDITEFMDTLQMRGIIGSKSSPDSGADFEEFLQIGAFCVKLVGPRQAFPPAFDPFVTSIQTPVHQTIRVLTCRPPMSGKGQVLLRNKELMVLENNHHFTLLFPSAPHIYELLLTKDGSLAELYCDSVYDDTARLDLFHAMRLPFLYLALQQNQMVIHSASLLYRNQAFVFSAASGIGKSTHTGLWQKLFDTCILNGDLNLLSFQSGKPFLHGLPWCGTSGISTPGTYPLGGIVFLRQAPNNRVEDLSKEEKTLSVLNRLITPCWTEEMLHRCLSFAKQLAAYSQQHKLVICRLNCTADAQAAHVMKTYLDSYMDK